MRKPSTLYWGTSNPGPDFDGSVRPGDNLYTDCVLALDPDTGKLKWHFQFTPHDLFDYDATETSILIDAVYRGEPQQVAGAGEPQRVHLCCWTGPMDRFLSATPFADPAELGKGH